MNPAQPQLGFFFFLKRGFCLCKFCCSKFFFLHRIQLVGLLCHCFALTCFALLSLALTPVKWNGKYVTCYGRCALPHIAVLFIWGGKRVTCYGRFALPLLCFDLLCFAFTCLIAFQMERQICHMLRSLCFASHCVVFHMGQQTCHMLRSLCFAIALLSLTLLCFHLL